MPLLVRVGVRAGHGRARDGHAMFELLESITGAGAERPECVGVGVDLGLMQVAVVCRRRGGILIGRVSLEGVGQHLGRLCCRSSAAWPAAKGPLGRGRG